MQITVCGGGNAAHTLAGLLAAQPGLSVDVYLPLSGEARRWQEGIAAAGGITVRSRQNAITGKPACVSAEPSEVLPGSRYVLLALPAFAHEIVLKKIAAYLPANAYVGAFPARGGFDLCFKDVLQSSYDSLVLFGLQTLPWACRITRFGQEVSVLGTKAQVDLVACPSERTGEIASTLSDLLGVSFTSAASFLSLTLADTGQLIHPGIMYGLFHLWGGKPYSEAPLFYQGVDETTADVLQYLSDEIQSISAALQTGYPGLDLTAVRPLKEWLLRSYPSEIEDPSSLRSCFVTNRSYAGLQVPMRQVPGGWVPDFNARYLSEDIPYNLLVTRGIAELAGVRTPYMDAVITWAQQWLGREYLVAGKLQASALGFTRAPQRYGYDDLESLVTGEYQSNRLRR